MIRRKIKTTEEFINRANEIHSDKYDYSKIEFKKYKKKVLIVCFTHGEFWQSPNKHLGGQNCPTCSNLYKKTNIKDTNYFITQANMIHGNKYDYSKTIYFGSNKILTINCYEHGLFQQIASVHLSGSGCSFCTKKIDTLYFINKANIIHNNKYDYSQSNYISTEKIKIKCLIHGVFEQAPHSHLQGSGCSKCSFELKTITTKEFIKKAIDIHGETYSYIKSKYIKSKENIIITCRHHGDFKQIASNHLRGFGCSFCSGKHKFNYKNFIEEGINVHGNRYDYSKSVINNSSDKTIIICKKHGDFYQSPHNHLNGAGCSSCSSNVSKIETLWLNKLEIKQKYRVSSVKIKNKLFKVDAYDPSTNTIYEFYGDYWHGNPIKFKSTDINERNKTKFGELYLKTLNREAILKEAGYNIISIWESDFKLKEKK